MAPYNSVATAFAPISQTVNNWLIKNADFFVQYTRKREAQADFLLDEGLGEGGCSGPRVRLPRYGTVSGDQ
jgi:hypothetical protein